MVSDFLSPRDIEDLRPATLVSLREILYATNFLGCLVVKVIWPLAYGTSWNIAYLSVLYFAL
jgi:hypothetical protein